MTIYHVICIAVNVTGNPFKRREINVHEIIILYLSGIIEFVGKEIAKWKITLSIMN